MHAASSWLKNQEDDDFEPDRISEESFGLQSITENREVPCCREWDKSGREQIMLTRSLDDFAVTGAAIAERLAPNDPVDSYQMHTTSTRPVIRTDPYEPEM